MKQLGAVTLIEQYAVAALRDHGELYGVPLCKHVSNALGREIPIGEIYAAMGRLEDLGIVTTRLEAATAANPMPERVGRQRRWWKLAVT
jgi:hypothetical protein